MCTSLLHSTYQPTNNGHRCTNTFALGQVVPEPLRGSQNSAAAAASAGAQDSLHVARHRHSIAESVSTPSCLKSRIESVTSSQEAGKAATTGGESRHSCRTCICGCKRCQMKGETMLVSVESSDKLDISTPQQTVHVRSSEQLRRLCTKYFAEKQQTNY